MKLRELAIFTDNVDGVADFYERLLNAKPSHRSDGLAVFKIGDVAILIHSRYDPGPDDLPCENHTAFAVTNVDDIVSELEKRGLMVDFPPRDYAWGRSAYLRDPEGHFLELHESAEATPD